MGARYGWADGRRFRETDRDRDTAAVMTDNGFPGARIIAGQVADRIHVSHGARAVVGYVRAAMRPRVRALAIYRPFRRAVYLAALARHAENRAEWAAVETGQLTAAARARALTAARAAMDLDLDRYGAAVPAPITGGGYPAGYRAGRADRFLGADRSLIAVSAAHRPGADTAAATARAYGRGYSDGYDRRLGRDDRGQVYCPCGTVIGLNLRGDLPPLARCGRCGRGES